MIKRRTNYTLQFSCAIVLFAHTLEVMGEATDPNEVEASSVRQRVEICNNLWFDVEYVAYTAVTHRSNLTATRTAGSVFIGSDNWSTIRAGRCHWHAIRSAFIDPVLGNSAAGADRLHIRGKSDDRWRWTDFTQVCVNPNGRSDFSLIASFDCDVAAMPEGWIDPDTFSSPRRCNWNPTTPHELYKEACAARGMELRRGIWVSLDTPALQLTETNATLRPSDSEILDEFKTDAYERALAILADQHSNDPLRQISTLISGEAQEIAFERVAWQRDPFRWQVWAERRMEAIRGYTMAARGVGENDVQVRTITTNNPTSRREQTLELSLGVGPIGLSREVKDTVTGFSSQTLVEVTVRGFSDVYPRSRTTTSTAAEAETFFITSEGFVRARDLVKAVERAMRCERTKGINQVHDLLLEYGYIESAIEPQNCSPAWLSAVLYLLRN